jgi:uncharacterized protein YdhG (YjbR/CyaY superfamily)
MKPTDVDDYIANADPEARSTLERLRELVRVTIPDAEERISYGVPFYKYHGELAGFAAYRKHVSFGGAADLDGEERTRLEAEGYATGKKTVRIGFDQEVPAAAIERILRAQAKLNEAR